MEYISINEKVLIELYGASDNEMVDKMMALVIEQALPKMIDYLHCNKEKELTSKTAFLNDFTPSFNMIGLSAISTKIELLQQKIADGADASVLNEAYANLEQCIYLSETLIKAYRTKINK